MCVCGCVYVCSLSLTATDRQRTGPFLQLRKKYLLPKNNITVFLGFFFFSFLSFTDSIFDSFNTFAKRLALYKLTPLLGRQKSLYYDTLVCYWAKDENRLPEKMAGKLIAGILVD